MSESSKAKTNKKWASNDKYRENYDRIFSKQDDKKDSAYLDTFRNV